MPATYGWSRVSATFEDSSVFQPRVCTWGIALFRDVLIQGDGDLAACAKVWRASRGQGRGPGDPEGPVCSDS